MPAIIGMSAGAAIVAGGYWLASRVSAKNLGVKGVALLSLIALVATSVLVFGIRVTQAEPNLQAPEEWRLFDPITRAEDLLPPGFTI